MWKCARGHPGGRRLELAEHKRSVFVQARKDSFPVGAEEVPNADRFNELKEIAPELQPNERRSHAVKRCQSLFDFAHASGLFPFL